MNCDDPGYKPRKRDPALPKTRNQISYKGKPVKTPEQIRLANNESHRRSRAKAKRLKKKGQKADDDKRAHFLKNWNMVKSADKRWQLASESYKLKQDLDKAIEENKKLSEELVVARET